MSLLRVSSLFAISSPGSAVLSYDEDDPFFVPLFPSRLGIAPRSSPAFGSTSRTTATWARYNTVFSVTVSCSTKSEDNSASSVDSVVSSVSCCGSPYFVVPRRSSRCSRSPSDSLGSHDQKTTRLRRRIPLFPVVDRHISDVGRSGGGPLSL